METENAFGANDNARPGGHSHRDYRFGTFQERLEHFCLLSDINVPEFDIEANGEPQDLDAVLNWALEVEGSSLDWLLAGSPSSLLLRRTRAERDTIGSDNTEALDASNAVGMVTHKARCLAFALEQITYARLDESNEGSYAVKQDESVLAITEEVIAKINAIEDLHVRFHKIVFNQTDAEAMA
ncbi:MAG: hypothetical protein AAGA28_01500 [Pseudomonadota bacterium]